MDELSETAALRAMAHPLRLRMLSLLTGAELSAAEVARELGVTHANASYHLRVLLDAGELEVAGEEKIRGGVAKRMPIGQLTFGPLGEAFGAQQVMVVSGLVYAAIALATLCSRSVRTLDRVPA